MENILCKAKRIDNREWIEGYVVFERYPRHPFVRPSILEVDKDGAIKIGSFEEDYNYQFVKVDQDTICRFTGLTDKNNKKIWTNSICKYYNPEDKDGIGVIEDDFVNWIGGTIAKKEVLTPLFYLTCSEEWEVIGNIFDDETLIVNT